MHEKIAITGSKGRIGEILTRRLTGYDILGIDKPEVDVRDYSQLLGALTNRRQVLHLAWNSVGENFRNGQIDPDNALMALNVYRASQALGVNRIILASSIHADTFYGWQTPPLLSIDHPPIPDSPYGADKVELEDLGREYAKQGLEVVALRIGGINPANVPPPTGEHPEERHAWLSHNDLVSLIKRVIDAPEIPGGYTSLYVVSDNSGRIHDTSNIFGWEPKDNAEMLATAK